LITFAHLKKGVSLLIIPIKDGENIDRALKRYKRKFDKTGTVRQLRARTAFIKPSVKNRIKIQKSSLHPKHERRFRGLRLSFRLNVYR
jgi:small subunit ribosomal protein S21